MTALLLLAMLQVPDTLTVRVPLPRQEVPRDTVVNVVEVQVHTDSLAAAYREGAARAELSLAQALEGCGCSQGDPWWFHGGLLALGAVAVYYYRQSVLQEVDPLEVEEKPWRKKHGRE